MNRLVLILCAAAMAASAIAWPAVAATTGPPTATTGKATNVTAQSAQIAGTVNPHGHPTSYYFELGKTTSYGTRTATGDAGSGTSNVNVSATLTGLSPVTTYHYRLVAFSPAGTSRGADKTFKTPQVPTTSSITAAPNPVTFGGIIAVTGFLTGPNVSNQQVALEVNPFPYTAGFQQVGNTVLTSAQGGYSFVYTPIGTAQLRVVDKSKSNVASPVVTENVALKTSLSARRSHHNHRRVKFSGRVLPARVGNAVLIQRNTRKGFRTVGVTVTKAKTTSFSGYAKTLTLHKGGTYRVVVRTTNGDYVDGTSRTVHLSLR